MPHALPAPGPADVDARRLAWADRQGANPADHLCQLLDELGLHGKRVGVETQTVGLTAFNWQALNQSLKGRLELVIGSGPAALLCRYQSGRRNLQSRHSLDLVEL